MNNKTSKKYVYVTDNDRTMMVAFENGTRHLKPSVRKISDGHFIYTCPPVKSMKHALESIAEENDLNVTIKRIGDRTSSAFEHEYEITLNR